MQKLKRNKRGRESDEHLLEVIKNYSGLSQYELSKKIKWPSGRTDGAIRRLLNENCITIKNIERNGRLVNLIYPKDSKQALKHYRSTHKTVTYRKPDRAGLGIHVRIRQHNNWYCRA